MLILVINCGSSSAKYQLFDMDRGAVLARGVIDRIGDKDSCHDHSQAIVLITGVLTDKTHGALKSINEIDGIGHRVVHGGEEFSGSVAITGKVMDTLEKFSRLAPLHNPPSLLGIKACMKQLPGVKQVAVFDTAFHQTMPAHAYIYGLPYEFYKKHGIRRYGFHGTSHKFVAQKTAELLKKPLSKLKVITCHLGNGCSMTAVMNGRSVDTSMGFTPLEGLLMGTRCGDLDPAIVTFLMENEGLDREGIEELLNKKSGLLGVSGVSNDMRDISAKAKEGDKRAKLAVDIFVYRIKKYIGAYAAAMDGVDCITFTAGIGENQPGIINRIKDELKNVLKNLKAKVLVVPANEELLIAQETYEKIS